ncbi:MAG: CpaF family protein, partial [Candidatus Omnitrophota bacterium]
KKLVKEILDEALGLGPLEDLLSDPTITDIMVNNKDEVYIERNGKIELTSKKFIANEQVRTIIERIIAPIGRRIDESVPMVDARLADGSRVNAIIPPLALTGPTLTIRKFRKERFKIEELIGFNTLSQMMAEFIKACVVSRKNTIVSGGTGSGKTTILNVLSGFIPHNERIVTIEDAAELRLHQDHWLRLESRPPNIEGKGAISIKDLFRNTLRMRPDRIIIGECRGIETLDMLQAMNTGHDGSMTTIHANSTQDVLVRLDSMILMSGIELPIRAIREMVASAIDLIVHTARLSDGSRKVIQITEVVGMKDELHIDLRDIFIFKQAGIDASGRVLGDFQATGYVPSFIEEIKVKGILLPEGIFQKPL